MTRLAAVRGKLAINAQTLSQVVRNGKMIWPQKAQKGTNVLIIFVPRCGSICMHGWGVGVGDEATTATRFVFVRSADRDALFGFEGAL